MPIPPGSNASARTLPRSLRSIRLQSSSGPVAAGMWQGSFAWPPLGRGRGGRVLDRAPIRHLTADGRVFELELSLSQRRKAGNPLAVRCLLRDVTHQKQRERRLALQLAVCRIVGENASPEVAA